jgi:hypothetical protein
MRTAVTSAAATVPEQPCITRDCGVAAPQHLNRIGQEPTVRARIVPPLPPPSALR